MSVGPAAPTSIVGRYALFDELARGGMATVHIGRLLGPAGFSRTVAIKRLHPHLAADPSFVAMLLDEARLAGRIQHPNVAATLDVVAQDGELFVVMEYLHGESLSRLARLSKAKDARIPANVAVAIVVAALHGLHAAHEVRGEGGEPLGIVHRDVSPQNIMVRRDGSAVVVDFGVAKAAGRFQTTEEGQVKGKLPYMAPEQVRGGVVTRRVDVYAAFAVLWEALVGQRLFSGANEGEVLEQLLFSTVKPPSALAAGVSPALDAVVMRGLERDPGRRFPDARTAALALEEALPPALPSRVSAWLEELAGAALDERAARVAAVESASTLSRATELADLLAAPKRAATAQALERAPVATPGSGGEGAPATGVTIAVDVPAEVHRPGAARDANAPSSGRKGAPRALALGAFAAVFVGALIFAAVSLRFASSPSDGRAPWPPPPSSSAASAAPDAPPSASSASSAPPALASASASAPGGKSAPPPRRPKAAADCSVPYTLDANGKKRYKRECL